MGYRSFGCGEVELQDLLDLLMDPAARKKFDNQTAEGRTGRARLITRGKCSICRQTIEEGYH